MSSDDLVAWLRAQLDGDEKRATDFLDTYDVDDPRWHGWRVAAGEVVTSGGKVIVEAPDDGEWQPALLALIAGHANPWRVLRQVEAHRRILDGHAHFPVNDTVGCTICALVPREVVIAPDGWCPTVRLLASIYSDRPGYRDEWRPA